ncbi:MAG: hypothetical protein K6T29_10680 [Peptococcaceae bacterium]|nr:hypothetical protein [Peptococcaceae bacterium]
MTPGPHEQFNQLSSPQAKGPFPPAVVYACGPVPMMRRVSEIALAAGIPCQVSLEERMGCGVGACLACACKTGGNDGAVRYRRVCADGPVFPAEEVVWP